MRYSAISNGLRKNFLRLRNRTLTQSIAKNLDNEFTREDLLNKLMNEGLSKSQAYYYLNQFISLGYFTEFQNKIKIMPLGLIYLTDQELSKQSNLQIEILLALLEKTKGPTELKNQLTASRQKIHQNLRVLKSTELISSTTQLDDVRKVRYALTDKGEDLSKHMLISYVSSNLIETNSTPQIIDYSNWAQMLEKYGVEQEVAKNSIKILHQENGANTKETLCIHKFLWYPINMIIEETAKRCDFASTNISKTVESLDLLLNGRLDIGMVSLPNLMKFDKKTLDQLVIVDILNCQNWWPLICSGKGEPAYREDTFTEKSLIQTYSNKMKKEAVGIEDENEYYKGIIDGDYATFFAPQPMYSFFNAEKENEILGWHSLPFGIITNKNVAESNIGHIKRFRESLRNVLIDFNYPQLLTQKTKEYITTLPLQSNIPPQVRNFKTFKLLAK